MVGACTNVRKLPIIWYNYIYGVSLNIQITMCMKMGTAHGFFMYSLNILKLNGLNSWIRYHIGWFQKYATYETCGITYEADTWCPKFVSTPEKNVIYVLLGLWSGGKLSSVGGGTLK